MTSTIVAGTVMIGLAQIALAIWMVRTVRELALARERMSRLADGLSLLTDTTESGLATITRAILQLSGQTTARTESRTVIAKRVIAAARGGTRVARIAATEALSESEVRLHLKLAAANGIDAESAQSA